MPDTMWMGMPGTW